MFKNRTIVIYSLLSYYFTCHYIHCSSAIVFLTMLLTLGYTLLHSLQSVHRDQKAAFKVRAGGRRILPQGGWTVWGDGTVLHLTLASNPSCSNCYAWCNCSLQHYLTFSFQVYRLVRVSHLNLEFTTIQTLGRVPYYFCTRWYWLDWPGKCDAHQTLNDRWLVIRDNA